MQIHDYIPLDKSWIIRMGILDLVHGRTDIVSFLDDQAYLGDDLVALKHAIISWNAGMPIDVGESGTLYRFLRFAAWKLGIEKEFVRQGTLRNRKITDDPAVIELSQEELLKLDNGTSQWASAAVLLGDPRRISTSSFKLLLTYEAVEHWQAQRAGDMVWQPRLDETILKQAQAFVRLLHSQPSDFVPEQAEDFCFAYCLCGMSAQEGERRWPSLRGHESDRITEIARELSSARVGRPVNSRDHRVVHAIAMWGRLNKKIVRFTLNSPQAVAKTWPRFWDFLADCT